MFKSISRHAIAHISIAQFSLGVFLIRLNHDYPHDISNVNTFRFSELLPKTGYEIVASTIFARLLYSSKSDRKQMPFYYTIIIYLIIFIVDIIDIKNRTVPVFFPTQRIESSSCAITNPAPASTVDPDKYEFIRISLWYQSI